MERSWYGRRTSHLPRRIGEALRHAYHGELEFHHAQEAYFIRVRWSRDG
jgi:hypothetical protein